MLETLIFALGLNGAGFLIAYMLKTDKLTDISYSLTFIGILLFGLTQSDLSAAKLPLAVLVLLWAIRLGGFLLIRIHAMGRDKRFDEMRGNFMKFGQFWLLQAITAWVVMLPMSFVFLRDTGSQLSNLLLLGIVTSFIGIAIESTADFQKFAFNQDQRNKGKWIESGVWRYSRHPNYFGEIMMWSGVYIACLPYLVGREVPIALASPLLITLLLVFVSGIPLLEKSADKKWGTNKDYLKYRAATSILIPLPRRKSR